MSRIHFDRAYRLPLLGMDEVGCGCIAGPLVAAGVVLPDEIECWHDLERLNVRDSKQMTESARRRVAQFVSESGIWYHVATLDPWLMKKGCLFDETTRLFRRIHTAATEAHLLQTVLVDGNERGGMTKHIGVVKGDDLSMTIAVASVMAKVWRDKFMDELSKRYGGYDWANNKGYPTERHLTGLRARGVTRWHRAHTKPVVRALIRTDGHRRAEASGRRVRPL